MRIYVCVKHVPDSAANIHVLDETRIDENVAFLLNPYDEHAVSEAAAVKSGWPGSEIIAVTLGKPDAEATLRSAMAMGADRGILVSTDALCDSMVTARALAAAIQSDGKPDLIFTGKESIDAEGMQTQFRLGAALDMPVVTNVSGLSIDGNSAQVVCELAGGQTRTFEAKLPCVVGAGRGLNTPGYPTLPDIMKSRKKPVKELSLDSLGLVPVTGSAKMVKLSPLTQTRSPKQILGNPAQMAAEIIKVIQKEGGLA